MPSALSPSRPRRTVGAAAAVAILAVGGAALAHVPRAEARIVPGKSVAGIALGATADSVRARLGTPEQGSTVLNYRYIRSRGFGIYFIAGRAFEITVVRGPQTTTKGIRVGSRLTALRRAHPKAACAAAVVGANTVECRLPGRLADRTTETLFTARAGTVTSIAIHFAG